MPRVLTEEQLRQYRRDGFVFPIDCISPEEAAGYMKKIGPKVLSSYRGRVINIHPALLPRYGGQGMYGMHVHQAVLAAGDTETGVTVHCTRHINRISRGQSAQ